ncbi:MAG: hypothetical protein H0X62_01515 [Bacteroidetes bacterium]|nr:hypothetical protein [Bacteroidota bacterium]
MKKLFLALLLIPVLSVFAQETTPVEKIRNNEFGIDATSFFRQYLNFGQQQQAYVPNYYLTYRRYFGPGNIRVALGGNITNYQIPTNFPADENDYRAASYDFDARLGWEFTTELGRRWQVFYGLDARAGLLYSKNDAHYWNGGYANGIETRVETYGIAPVLGFRFKLNDRLSLLTETTYALNWQQRDDRRYFTPVMNQPPLPDFEHPRRSIFFTSFQVPVLLFFTFTI